MADLQLNIKGDSTEAVEAFRDVGKATGNTSEEVGKAVAKWNLYAQAIQKAVEVAVRFGKEAVKEWQAAERVTRQLERAAGDYAKVLEKQAESLSKVLGVDDDLVKQQQTLLAQWGGAGAAAEDVTRAILDYAAATGQDAIAATQGLIQQVESGGAGLKKLGIDFKATGDRGKDLAAAVAGLSAKFGGAAAAEGDSLTRQLNLADQAFGDIKEEFGKVIGEFVAGSSVITGLTDIVRTFQMVLFGDPNDEKRQKLEMLFVRQQAAAQQLLDARRMLEEAKGDPSVSLNVLEMFSDDVESAKKKVAELRAEVQALMGGGAAPLELPTVTGQTAAGKAAAERANEEARRLQEQNVADWREWLKQMEEIDAADEARRAKAYEDASSDLWKRVEEEEKGLEALEKAKWDFARKEAEREDKAREQQLADEAKATDEAMKAANDRMKTKADQAKASADAIGAAFVNGLTAQLSKLAEGEELDPAMFVGEILAATVSAAAAIIGSVYGMPALGAAVGNLAAMGIRAGASGISAQAKKGGRRSYHTGGWVGDESELPRYHSGAWIRPDEQMAVLQQGERVLSRSEVTAMGGPRGVDGAAGGARPGFVVNVSALDAKSAAESFVSGVDRGLRDALRSGQGFLPQLLPQGVR